MFRLPARDLGLPQRQLEPVRRPGQLGAPGHVVHPQHDAGAGVLEQLPTFALARRHLAGKRRVGAAELLQVGHVVHPPAPADPAGPDRADVQTLDAEVVGVAFEPQRAVAPSVADTERRRFGRHGDGADRRARHQRVGGAGGGRNGGGERERGDGG